MPHQHRAAEAAHRSGDFHDRLRLYQLTGDEAWLAAARRQAHMAARNLPAGSADLPAALALIAVETPFRPVRPPFDWV